jgi:hypothetical protein
MNYTSNWNKFSGDKMLYIYNLRIFLRIVKMSI